MIAPCHLARSESTAHRAKKQQHHQIANRVAQPSGAATPRDSDAHHAHRCPEGSLRSSGVPPAKDQKRQSLPFYPLATQGFRNVRNAPRVVIPPPPETAPVSPCKPLCARLRAGVACVPAFAHESEHGPFVPEVLKTVWTMCWKRWYDCISYAFRSFSEDEKESRIKGWRRNRRSAQSLLPAVRAVDGGFSAVGCGAF